MSAFCRKKNLNYFRNITSTSFFEQKTFWSRTFVIQYTVRRTAKKLKIIYYISYISETVRNNKKNSKSFEFRGVFAMQCKKLQKFFIKYMLTVKKTHKCVKFYENLKLFCTTVLV